MRRSVLARFLLSSSLVVAAVPALHAAEGGVTHYLPGVAADLNFALPPGPGWQVKNVIWSQSGHLDGSVVLGGEVAEDVDIDTVLDIVIATYTTDFTIFGGTYTAGVIVPFGRSEVSGDLAASGGSFSDDSVGFGDISFIPFQLNWQRGDFYFEVFQSIIAPTGNFDEDEYANVGRGYWGFDTVGSFTWFKQEWGTEVSFSWGLMHNAENTNSEYHTANESHFDWAVNQYITDDFAVGLRGFRLNQLKHDSGEGALVGYAEGFEQGWGAGLVWHPADHLTVSGSYMRDSETRQGRFDSDYAQLTVDWTF